MTVSLISSFLLYSTLLNLGLYTMWAIIYYCFKDKILGIQKDFIDLDEKDIKKSIYLLFGFYKFLIVFFNVIPLVVINIFY